MPASAVEKSSPQPEKFIGTTARRHKIVSMPAEDQLLKTSWLERIHGSADPAVMVLKLAGVPPC